jgi:PAS domain S-box-containing protein
MTETSREKVKNAVTRLIHPIIPFREWQVNRTMDDDRFPGGRIRRTFQQLEKKIQQIVGQSAERRETEEALRESEVRLNAVIRGSPIPQFVIDRDHKVIQWNEALEVYSGISAKEVLGTNQQWRAFYPSERPCMADLLVEGQIEKISRWYAGKYTKSPLIEDAYEATDFFPHMGPSGTWLRFTAAPIRDEKGEIIGAVETLDDITQRKTAEESLARKAEELARSNTELEQFAYIASHDLQEPLRMIGSYLQLIERRYKGRLDEDADDFIAFAVDGAKRLQVMINGLLEFSRVQTRGLPFIPVDTGKILEEAVGNVKIAIGESHAVITHDPLPVINGDTEQLVRVFQNLINNAIKFRSRDVPRIHVSAQQKDRAWVFSFRDNGIGIDKEYQDRLFVLFRRLHGPEYSGTGIGLAVCKRIIERHGGKIWVESEPGRGLTFFFTIPVQAESGYG